jgi:hypothetical protein
MRYYEDQNWELYIDFEMRRMPLELRINPLKRIQLSFNMQYIYMTGGFTDILISKTHELLHLDGQREDSNRTHYYLKSKDRIIYNISERIKEWADPTFGLKINFLDRADFPVKASFKFLYKKPTESSESIFNSGDKDFGGALLLDARFKRFTCYLNLGRIFTGKSRKLKPIAVDDFFYGYFVAEYNVSEKFRTLLQLSAMQSPYRNNPLTGLREPPVEFLVGIGYKINEHAGFELGFSQDLTVTVTEFGISLGFNYKF